VALTERYVTAGASGGGDGSSGSPWTIVEAAAACAAGDRINVQSDATYTLGAQLLAGSNGSQTDPIIWRGYNSSIGDLNSFARDSTGYLTTTNMPAINTAAYNIKLKNFHIFESLNIYGAPASGGTNFAVVETVINAVLIGCVVKSTATAGGSTPPCCALEATQRSYYSNCDFIFAKPGITSGDNFAVMYTSGAGMLFDHCRFAATGFSTDNNMCEINHGHVYFVNCTFDGGATAYAALYYNTPTQTFGGSVNCNFYDMDPTNGSAITRDNGDHDDIYILSNCMATDMGYVFESEYSAGLPFLIVNSRTRDVASASESDDWPTYNVITTDTGDETTDYRNPATGDFRLVRGSPGFGVGYLGSFDRSNIGAFSSHPKTVRRQPRRYG
jgi:hypothetical protein